MIAWAFLTRVLGAEPDVAALDDVAWKDAGTRRTDVGAVALQASYVDGIACVQGLATVDVGPEHLLAVNDDMVSAPAWSSADLTHSRELSRDETGFVLFQRLNVPAWTLSSDRYWVLQGHTDRANLRYRWSRLDGGSFASIEAEAAGAIEPPVNYGEWSYEVTDAGTRVRYRACADFGGPVPAAVQRWVTVQQVPALMEDLIGEAARRSATD